MLVMDTARQDSGCHCRQPGTRLNVGQVSGRGSHNPSGHVYRRSGVRSSRVDAVGQDSGYNCQQPRTKSDESGVSGRRSHKPSGLDYPGRSNMNLPPMNAFRKFGLSWLAVKSAGLPPCDSTTKTNRVEQVVAADRQELHNFKPTSTALTRRQD